MPTVYRCAPRSIAATATFATTASLTAVLRHSTLAPLPGDPSLGAHGGAFLAGGVAALISTLAASRVLSTRVYARQAIAFCTAVGFAFAMRLSNLTDSRRVIGFLLTPAHTAFDPSLAYLAVGAIPLTSLLYRIGEVRVPKKGKVDGRLLAGAALFGVGWGIEGICRKLLLGRHAARSPLMIAILTCVAAPGLINFGWALATGSNIKPLATFFAAVVIGGFLVPS